MSAMIHVLVEPIWNSHPLAQIFRQMLTFFQPYKTRRFSEKYPQAHPDFLIPESQFVLNA